MSKSATTIKAAPAKFSKNMTRHFNRKMVSVKGTYNSQLKADPQMELRKQLQTVGMNRVVTKAQAEKDAKANGLWDYRNNKIVEA